MHATSWTACRNRCPPTFRGGCGRPGSWTQLARPRRFSANRAWHLAVTGRAPPPRSWKGAERRPKRGRPPEPRRSRGLHHHHRAWHGHGAAGQPERNILARAFAGSGLSRRGHAGSHPGRRQGLSPPQGLPAASPAQGGARRSQGMSAFIEPPYWSNHEGRAGSKPAPAASRFSTSSGASPFKTARRSFRRTGQDIRNR
jgi:hypothetical protein